MSCGRHCSVISGICGDKNLLAKKHLLEFFFKKFSKNCLVSEKNDFIFFHFQGIYLLFICSDPFLFRKTKNRKIYIKNLAIKISLLFFLFKLICCDAEMEKTCYSTTFSCTFISWQLDFSIKKVQSIFFLWNRNLILLKFNPAMINIHPFTA